MRLVSIIIPNFNGRNLLERNLPVLLSRCQEDKIDCEIIVVDDASSDDSVDFVRSQFPKLKVIALQENHGFAYACNIGVKAADSQVVYLLNSDVAVCSGFLKPLLAYFEKDDLFAASSIEADSENSDRTSISFETPLVRHRLGIFWYWYQPVRWTKESSRGLDLEVFCVSAGHSAYCRSKFLELGGFDAIFRPFYAEDGDICWRAWKRGWKSVIVPQSSVIHERGKTINKHYSLMLAKSIHWKNRMLMTWKNLSSGRLIAKSIFFLLPEFLLCPFIGKIEFSRGVFMALAQLPELFAARVTQGAASKGYSDLEFFKRFSRLPAVFVMNILYLHETAQMSGAENSLLNLAVHLDKNKFCPHFALSSDGPLKEELRKIGCNVHLVHMPQVRKLRGVFSAVKKIRKIVREEKISLLHSNSIRTHIYASIVGKLECVPVIWHQRNLITKERIDPDRVLSLFPNRIICNSFSISRRFLRRGRIFDNVRVVYNGVDTLKFSPFAKKSSLRRELGISEGKTVIGMASRLGPDKGQEVFLKAAKIVSTCPEAGDCLFLIVGDAVFDQDKWRQGFLLTMAEDLGLGEKVIFAGFRNDMPDVYGAMDIFVLASYAEPCGRVILEAMSMARPIVATRSGGTPEMICDGKTGILVSPGNEHDLAKAILSLAKNKEQARHLGAEARRVVEEKFGIETNARKIEQEYLELISGDGAKR